MAQAPEDTSFAPPRASVAGRPRVVTVCRPRNLVLLLLLNMLFTVPFNLVNKLLPLPVMFRRSVTTVLLRRTVRAGRPIQLPVVLHPLGRPGTAKWHARPLVSLVAISIPFECKQLRLLCGRPHKWLHPVATVRRFGRKANRLALTSLNVVAIPSADDHTKAIVTNG